MSILAYTGLPGSGKSYNAVANVILPGLRQGRRVVTNIPLDRDLIEREGWGWLHVPVQSDELRGDALMEIVADNHGAVFVLDEIWRAWPTGMRQRDLPSGHAQWLAEHRHHVGDDGRTDELVLVTQDLAQVAAPVRQLVETTYVHRKLTAVGMAKRFKVNVYQGAVTGSGQPSKLLNELTGRYSSEVFRWYQSHTHSDSGDPGLEQAADRRGNIFRSPKFLAIAAFGVLAPIGGIVAVASSFSGMVEGEPETDRAADQAAVVQQVEPVAKETPARDPERSEGHRVRAAPMPTESVRSRLPESERWWVCGEMRTAGRHLVLLRDRDGRTRRVSGSDCELVAGELECQLGAWRVTSYSGKRADERQERQGLAQPWAASQLSQVTR